jgi:hypothetical protein
VPPRHIHLGRRLRASRAASGEMHDPARTTTKNFPMAPP